MDSCVSGRTMAQAKWWDLNGISVTTTMRVLREGRVWHDLREGLETERVCDGRTLMAGCVLVESLLFSPGMLPADLPSHL